LTLSAAAQKKPSQINNNASQPARRSTGGRDRRRRGDSQLFPKLFWKKPVRFFKTPGVIKINTFF